MERGGIFNVHPQLRNLELKWSEVILSIHWLSYKNVLFIYLHAYMLKNCPSDWKLSSQCLQNLAIMQTHTYTQRLCRFPKHSHCTCGESRISGLSIVTASHCLPKELLSSSVSTTPIRVNKHSHTCMHTLYPFHYTSRWAALCVSAALLPKWPIAVNHWADTSNFRS